MYLDDNEEGGQVCTLDEKLLSAFRVNDQVTITIKGKGISKTFKATIEKVKGTETYKTTDYDTPAPKNGSRKQVVKTRPGCIEFDIGKEVPMDMDSMVSAMDGD